MLRATQDTIAYERVGPGSGPGAFVARKVFTDQFVPDSWFGDEDGTVPVEGTVEDTLPLYGNAVPPPSSKYQVPDDSGQTVLRATVDTTAYEPVGHGVVVARKVIAGHWVPATWFGDEAATMPVEGAVEEALTYGLAVPPAAHRFQVEAEPPVPLGVEPNSLPLTTAPPFVLTYSGEFDTDAEYEASIVSASGQWTITPSPHGEGGTVVVNSENEVVATFEVAPDADRAGTGYTQLKNLATGQLSDRIPFTWEGEESGGGTPTTPTLTSVNPNTCDLAIAPGDVTFIGTDLDNPAIQEARLFDNVGMWSCNTGIINVTDAQNLVASFLQPLPSGAAGAGYAVLCDQFGANELTAHVPFNWTGAAREAAESQADDQEVTLEPGETAKVTAKPKAKTKAKPRPRHSAPDE